MDGKEENKLSSEYLLELSRLGKEYTSDYFSELTRKRQTALLISSVIALLIAYNIIHVDELSASGLKGTLTGVVDFSVIMGISCAYFLIVFLLSVKQDEELRKYSLLALSPTIQKLTDHLLQAFEDRIKRRNDLRNLHAQKLAEHNKNISEWYQEHSKQIGLSEFLENKGTSKELERIIKEIDSIPLDQEAIKMEKLAQTIQNRTWYARFRIILEFFFPVILGLYAIIISFS